jgi:hypothetical protein
MAAPPPPFVPADRLPEGNAPLARALLDGEFRWQVAVPPVVVDRFGDEIDAQLAAAETNIAQQEIIAELGDGQLNALAAALGTHDADVSQRLLSEPLNHPVGMACEARCDSRGV